MKRDKEDCKNQKKYFLVNPIWIGIATVIVLMIGLFIDIVIVDPTRRSYILPHRVTFCLIAGLLIHTAYIWAFLEKLARKYPEKREELLTIRKLLTIHTRRNDIKIKEMSLDQHSAISRFSDGSPAFEKIDEEWKAARKYLVFLMLTMILSIVIELFLGNWMQTARPAVLAWLGSIGF